MAFFMGFSVPYLLSLAKDSFPFALALPIGGSMKRVLLVALSDDLARCILYDLELMSFHEELASTAAAPVSDKGIGFVPGGPLGYFGVTRIDDKWHACAEGIKLGPFGSQLAAAIAYDDAMVHLAPNPFFTSNFAGVAGFTALGEALKKLTRRDAAKLVSEVRRVARLATARAVAVAKAHAKATTRQGPARKSTFRCPRLAFKASHGKKA